MVPPEQIEALKRQLEPAARVVVELIESSNAQLQATIESQRAQIEGLTAQISDLRHMLFGRKSEKLPSIQSEVRRVVEEEELFGEQTGESIEPRVELTDNEKKRRRRKRARAKSEPERKRKRGLRKGMPILYETVLVEPEKLPEGYTLEDFREIGEDSNVVTRIEHVREHLVSVRYKLQTLVSRDNEHIVTAAAPPTVVEKGHYGASVYADTIVKKCGYSLPLYRIERIFEQAGCPISRSTLCSLFHRAAQLMLPIYKRLLALVCAHPYLNADETREPVQKKGGCKDEWIWTLYCELAVVYFFSETRGSSVPFELLNGTEGYLQVDGYSAYNAVCHENGRKRVGCWAHARRLFFAALKDFPCAKEILDWIVDLYRIEYRAAEQEVLGTAEHLVMREQMSRPITNKIKAWLDEQEPKYPPKSKVGKAIKYAKKQWQALTVFLTDPRLALDNNVSENALRIIALGRKNFLFVGHEEGGQNLAVLQTIVGTCKLHNVNPSAYLTDVLIRIQSHRAKDIDQLLPQNWKPH
jgi:transposase